MKNLNSKIPLYVQLYNEIYSMIQNNVLKQGDKLLSEPELSQKYNVSRETVRKAIQELANDGLLEKVHGKGTFITIPKVQLDMSGFFSFREEMDKMHVNHYTKINNYKLIKKAPSKVVKKLSLEFDDEVYFIKRIRYYEDDPILIEKTYLPKKIFSNFNYLELKEKSIYKIFEEYNIKSVDGDEIYQPCLPSQEEKSLLEIKEDGQVPCIRIIRLLKSDNIPVEYTSAILKPGKMELKIHISK